MKPFEYNKNNYYITDPKNHIVFVGCLQCGYTKDHCNIEEINHIRQDVEFINYHFTCLCDLFKSSVICCNKGYQNMLSSLPFIAIYSPLPTHTTEHVFINNFNELAVSISGKERRKLNTEVLRTKIKAIKQQNLIKKKTLKKIKLKNV